MTATATTSPAAYARMIEESAPLLLRFLAGFDEGNRAVQTPSLPNHPIWTLGHCAFTMVRFAELAGSPPPASSDFELGHWDASRVQGTTDCFFIEDIAKDSTPSPDSNRYPSLARGVEVFEFAARTLATTLASATPAKLSELVPWGGSQQPISSLAIRVAVHNGIHAGQLTDLRRALGFPRILPANSPKQQPTPAR